MPTLEVTIQIVDDQDRPIWAYSHRAVLPSPPVDAEANALRMAEELNLRIEDGRQSVAAQIAADLEGGRLSATQAEAGACPDCHHSVLIHGGEGCDARLSGGAVCPCTRTLEALARG